MYEMLAKMRSLADLNAYEFLQMPETRNECGTGSGSCCNDHVCYEGEGKLEMNTSPLQNNIS